MKQNKLFKNLSLYMLGFIISSLGIYTFIAANIGVGTGESVSIGLSLHFPISIGIGSMLIHGTIISLNSVLTKKMPNLFVFFPIFLRGITIDLWIGLLGDTKIENVAISWFLLFFGIVLMGFGLGLYLQTNLPKIPVDAFIMTLSKLNKLSFRTNRTFFELSLVIIGWSLGGPIGIGTIIIATFLGPSIQFWDKKLVKFSTKKEPKIFDSKF